MRLFRDVLEPATSLPELGKRERRRYYFAYGFFVLLAILGLTVGFMIGVIAVFGSIGGSQSISRAILDPSYSHQFGHIWLPISLATAVLGFFAANGLWHFLFIKSAYLSHAAAQRLAHNRAPTERGEGMRVAIGYVTYLLIFFGLGIYMVVFGEGTPLHVFTAIGLNGLGVYGVVHAFLRYRRSRSR